jgi:hypothetical protein
MDAAAVDQHPAVERHRLRAADLEREALGARAARKHRRAQHHHAAGGFEIGLVGEHQGVAVDDPGRRREEGAAAEELGLERAGLVAADPFEVVDAVLLGLAPHAFEDRYLFFFAGDGELSDSRVRHAARGAIRIEPVASLDAEPRLEAAFWIMQPRMDHFAVARRGLGADPALLLEHHDLVPGERQRPRHGEADHARADHDAFDRFAHRLALCRAYFFICRSRYNAMAPIPATPVSRIAHKVTVFQFGVSALALDGTGGTAMPARAPSRAAEIGGAAELS